MSTLVTNAPNIASLSDKHCIFRCGAGMFSISATVVREIVPAPDLVSVPLCHDVLAGIGHVKNEFLPVIVLAPLVGEYAQVQSESGQLLVLNSSLGPWGLLIDKIVCINAVETHVDADRRLDSTLTPLLGTSSYEGEVISVLDANALHRVTQQALQSQWPNNE